MKETANPYKPFDSMQEWRDLLMSKGIRGMYVDDDGTLMVDRTYSPDSEVFKRFGPRTADINIIGAASLAVPGVVLLAFVQQAIFPPKQPVAYMGIH